MRYGETDQMGVVHHANFLLYFEEARTAMMKARGLSYAELERTGIGLPVRKVDIRYRTPALYEEELIVRTRVTETRAASVTFGYEILRAADGTRIATGSTELACVRLDDEPRRPIALPESFQELL